MTDADLRHTCASLLLAFGVPMKEIQEWLGHSDFNTTADIYAHLEYVSKVTAANSMVHGLKLGQLLEAPKWTQIINSNDNSKHNITLSNFDK